MPSIIYGFYQKILLFSSDNLIPKEALKGLSFLTQARIIERLKEERVFSFFPLPTSFCSFLSVISLISIGLGIYSKDLKTKFFYFIVSFLSLILMVFTKSFGGIAGFFAGFFLFLFIMGKKDIKILIILAIIAISIISVVIYLRLDTLTTKNPVTLRLLNWNLALKVISFHPFFGVGLNNYLSFSLSLAKERVESSRYAHNFFLQFTAETGVLCTILLLILLINWTLSRVKDIKNEPVEASLWGAFVSILFYNMVDIGIYFESFGFLFLIIISSLSKREELLKEIKGRNVLLFSLLILCLLLFPIWTYFTEELIQSAGFELKDDISKAEKKLIFAMKINPFHPRIYSYLSFVESRKGNFPLSLEYLEKSISLYPFSHSLYFERGIILLKLGESFKAYLSFREAEKLNPSFISYKDEIKKLEDLIFKRKE